MSIEDVVRELSEEEVEKRRPEILEKVKKDIQTFLKSSKAKKLIEQTAIDSIYGYFENQDMSEILSRAELMKITKRAFKV